MNIYEHEEISTSSASPTAPDTDMVTRRYTVRHVYRLFGFTVLTWTNTYTTIG